MRFKNNELVSFSGLCLGLVRLFAFSGMLEPLLPLAFALLIDDLDVLPLAVLPELCVRQELVHQGLLPILLGNPIRVVVNGCIDHVTNLEQPKGVELK